MPRPMTSAEIAALEALQEFAHLHELCRNGGAVAQAMHHEAERRLYAAWAEVETDQIATRDGRMALVVSRVASHVYAGLVIGWGSQTTGRILCRAHPQ